jgi:hypothetical protein
MKEELMSLLSDLRVELERSESDRETGAPTSDLQWVVGVLEKAEVAAAGGEKPRVPSGIARLVVDGWNLTSGSTSGH